MPKPPNGDTSMYPRVVFVRLEPCNAAVCLERRPHREKIALLEITQNP